MGERGGREGTCEQVTETAARQMCFHVPSACAAAAGAVSGPASVAASTRGGGGPGTRGGRERVGASAPGHARSMGAATGHRTGALVRGQSPEGRRRARAAAARWAGRRLVAGEPVAE